MEDIKNKRRNKIGVPHLTQPLFLEPVLISCTIFLMDVLLKCGIVRRLVEMKASDSFQAHLAKKTGYMSCLAGKTLFPSV